VVSAYYQDRDYKDGSACSYLRNEQGIQGRNDARRRRVQGQAASMTKAGATRTKRFAWRRSNVPSQMAERPFPQASCKVTPRTGGGADCRGRSVRLRRPHDVFYM